MKKVMIFTYEFMKSIGSLFAYYVISFIVYIVLMLLFNWMVNWWWFFIVILGIGGISSFALFGTISAIFAPQSSNAFIKVLSALVTIYLLYFTIHSVWTSMGVWSVNDAGEMIQTSNLAKLIVVKIIGTITFLNVYIPMIFIVISDDKKTNYYDPL